MIAWPHSWLLRIMASTASYLRCISASLNMYSLVSICGEAVEQGERGGGEQESGAGQGEAGEQGSGRVQLLAAAAQLEHPALRACRRCSSMPELHACTHACIAAHEAPSFPIQPTPAVPTAHTPPAHLDLARLGLAVQAEHGGAKHLVEGGGGGGRRGWEGQRKAKGACRNAGGARSACRDASPLCLVGRPAAQPAATPPS